MLLFADPYFGMLVYRKTRNLAAPHVLDRDRRREELPNSAPLRIGNRAGQNEIRSILSWVTAYAAERIASVQERNI